MIDPSALAHALGGEARGNAVFAPGPGHSRHDRSLSITVDPEAPDGFVVHSFANDDPLICKDYVRERAGLDRWQPSARASNEYFGYDFSQSANQNGSSGIVAEYVYSDAEGQPSRKVGRTADKQFPQWRWEGDRWISGVKGLPPYPYRLPELLASEGPVFICEGEKDVDRLAGLGFIATTNPGGAGNWKADLNRWFAGRTCYVLEDDDDAGRKRVQAIAPQLYPIAGEVRIVTFRGIKDGGDVSDWLDDNPGKPLIEYARNFPVWSPSAEPAADEWPEPDGRYLRAELPEPPALPLDDVFSPKWATWIRAAAEAKAAPPDYVVAAALAVCGSILGNTRWPLIWEGWSEPPVLWTVVIGNPSANKSPGLDAVLIPLKMAERRMREKAQGEVDDWRAKAEVAKLFESAWKETVKAAIKNDETPPDRPDNADPGPEPVMPRLAVSDTTVERLAVIVSKQPRGTLLARDELAGWLQGMTRYSGGGSDRPFWLEAYGGRGYTVERMGRDPVYIERLSVGVMGGIQPDRMRSLLMKSDDDGLLARFLPIWPHPAPVKRPSLIHDEQFMENAIGRLLTLEMPTDGDGHKRPWFVPFSSEARDLMDGFRVAVREWEDASEGLLKSFVGKLPGMVVRLSLVLAYLEWASDEAGEPREIDVAHFGRAAHLAESYLMPMARRAYADASAPAGERAARRLVDLIREEGWKKFTAREVRRMQRSGLLSMEDIDPAIKTLVEADLIRAAEASSGPRGGRPARLFIVNPVIHGRAA